MCLRPVEHGLAMLYQGQRHPMRNGFFGPLLHLEILQRAEFAT